MIIVHAAVEKNTRNVVEKFDKGLLYTNNLDY